MLALYEEALKRKHNFKKDFFNAAINDTESTAALQKELNHLTKQLIPKDNKCFKKLYFKKIPKTKYNSKSIKYSEKDTALLLEYYNYQLYNCYVNEYVPTIRTRIKRKARTALSLLKHNPKKLFKTINDKATQIRKRNEE